MTCECSDMVTRRDAHTAESFLSGRMVDWAATGTALGGRNAFATLRSRHYGCRSYGRLHMLIFPAESI
jgi:hypothetical protein